MATPTELTRMRISVLDLKLGLRMLGRNPGLTLIGGLGMAVAIAIAVGFFSFIPLLVYPTLPLEEGERIVALENRDVTVNNEERRSLHDFFTWREELETVEDLGAFRTIYRNLITGGATPEPVPVAEMTAAGFQVPRVPPLLGRYLVEADERPGAPEVVVIGHDVWQSRFDGDPEVVGLEVRLGSRPHTVVGVMPEDFAFPENHQYWTPLRARPSEHARREGPAIYIFGRLAPGVTMEAAQAELGAIGRRAAAAHPETHAELRPMVMPYAHSLGDVQGITRWQVAQMQFTMSLLLVVIALNVAVLVYARTARRHGEIAVRSALGASRWRVVGQLFAEALVFSLAAAAAGLALAQVGIGLGLRILETEMEIGFPFWMDFSLRPSTVLFTVGLAVVAAVIVGVLPALGATGRRLQADLRQLGGGTGMRLGRTWTALIVVQVAVAVAALPAAVHTGWSEIRQAATRPIYDAEEFLIARLDPEADAPADADAAPGGDAAAARFGDRLTELMGRVEAEPAVAGVTFRATVAGRGGRIRVEGMRAPPQSPSGHHVSAFGVHPGYFDLFDARLAAGRGFEPADLGAASRTVVVNRAFVRRVLGGEEALGRRIRHVDPEGEAEGEASRAEQWYEIVGVMEDLEANPADPDLVTPAVTYPLAPGEAKWAGMVVRIRGSTPADFAPRLRALAASVDPSLRITSVRSLAESNRQNQLVARLVALAVGLVLVSVFLLSAGGVYALMSFTVTQRRREIGIRSALGAHPRQVLRSVFARAARQVALGLGLGVAAALLIEHTSGGELMGGQAGIILPVLSATMLVVGLVSALGPARRGLRIEPVEALRADG